MSKGRKGAPTSDELQLWRQATKSVAPLARPPPPETEPEPEPPRGEPPAKKKIPPAAPVNPAIGRQPRPRPAAPPALTPIDRRTTSRLERGTIVIDARIDLHGVSQAAAHGRLHRFLRDAQARGARMALVITGKGRPRGEAIGDDRGVLRRMAPIWLASAEFRPLVVGFGQARPAHGGAGAIYVRIRRGRKRA